MRRKRVPEEPVVADYLYAPIRRTDGRLWIDLECRGVSPNDVLLAVAAYDKRIPRWSKVNQVALIRRLTITTIPEEVRDVE